MYNIVKNRKRVKEINYCIAIINQEGGVSKTTTAISLSVALQENRYKVLLIDFDAQANTINGIGFKDEE